MPFTAMRLGVGTSKVMPSGASIFTGWLNPSARSRVVGPWAAAR